jgi:uncharacterized membrane protein YoaT (DUF817 family)
MNDGDRTDTLVSFDELLWFGKTQILACLFGIFLLGGLMLTRYWLPDVNLPRNWLLGLPG